MARTTPRTATTLLCLLAAALAPSCTTDTENPPFDADATEEPDAFAEPEDAESNPDQESESDSPRVWSQDNHAWRDTIANLRLLHLEGTPYEMGHQHGELMAAEIHAFRAASSAIMEQITGLPTSELATMLYGLYEDHLDPDFLAEMQGIAAATGIPVEEVSLPNLVWEAQEVLGKGHVEHCSEFAALGEATVDGALLHGFNMDTSERALAELWNAYHVVVFYHPEGRTRFVAATMVGSVGVYSGMNLDGISIGWDNTRTTWPIEPTFFEPFVLTIRRALERAADLDQAVGLVTEPFRPLGDILIMADGEAGQAIAVETLAGQHAVREPERGVVWSANQFVSEKLAPHDVDQFTGDPAEDLRTNPRHLRYGELLTQELHGALDLRRGVDVLRDPYSSGDERFGPGQLTAICRRNRNELAVVYLPESLQLWVSTRSTPACAGEFVGLDAVGEAVLPADRWVEAWAGEP